MTVSKYEILTATSAYGLQEQVNARLPAMQPVGGVMTYGRHVLQPMARTGDVVAIADGQTVKDVDVGGQTLNVELGIEDDALTTIDLPATAAVVVHEMALEGIAIGDDTGTVTFTVVGGEITGITLDIDEP